MRFPLWFVPLFAAGMLVLILISTLFVVDLLRHRGSLDVSRSWHTTCAWALLPLSFICTSSVHAFLPFRPAVVHWWPKFGFVLKLNMILAATGLATTLGLCILYATGRRRIATSGLLLLGVTLLIPNDDCRNPFNEWWIDMIGASPLMFVPNILALALGYSN
jgi:hypothetical protein